MPAKIILETHDILLIEPPRAYLGQRAPFLRFEPVHIPLRDSKYLVALERYALELPRARPNRGSRIALKQYPLLGTVTVILEREPLARLYLEGLKMPPAAGIPVVKLSPRTHGAPHVPARRANHP